MKNEKKKSAQINSTLLETLKELFLNSDLEFVKVLRSNWTMWNQIGIRRGLVSSIAFIST